MLRGFNQLYVNLKNGRNNMLRLPFAGGDSLVGTSLAIYMA
jgi:hypothetical protein